MKINSLGIFDFDDTIFQSTGLGVIKLLKKLNLEENWSEMLYDRLKWYDNDESLNGNSFYFPVYKPIHDEYCKLKDKKENLNVLITHRVRRQLPMIKGILKQLSMTFDVYYAGDRKIPKTKFLKEVLDKNPNIKFINIYEDSVEQIKLYSDFIKKYNSKIKIKIFFVNTSYTYVFDDYFDINRLNDNKMDNILLIKN